MGIPETNGPNLRETQRNKVLKSAKIILDDKTTMDCTVRDISEDGAKLLISSTLSVPNQFRLMMTTEQTIRSVSVVRRTAQQLGIRFLEPAEKVRPRKS